MRSLSSKLVSDLVLNSNLQGTSCNQCSTPTKTLSISLFDTKP